MLREVLKSKRNIPAKFQVLFLRNDTSEEVEVHEMKKVDFQTVRERLENGESVFITSKNSQKINPPKQKNVASHRMKTKLVTAFYFEGT